MLLRSTHRAVRTPPLTQFFASIYGAEVQGVWRWLAFSPDPRADTTKPCALPDGAMITACNPWSESLTPRANQLRQHSLAQEVAALGFSALPALGASPDGLWRELSWFIPGLDRARTLALARHHQQHASLLIRSGRAGLLLTLTGSYLIRASLAAHPMFTDLPGHRV